MGAMHQALLTFHAPAVAAGLPVTDDFNRTDSASSLGTSTSGHAWSTHIGTMGISSNKIYSPSLGSGSGGFTGSIATVDSGAADCTIQITQSTARSAITRCGIAFRYVDADNFYVARYLWQSVRVEIYKMESGIFAGVGDASFPAPPAVEGQVMKVVLLGSSIKLYMDNVLKVDITNTAHQSATKHGVFINNTDTRQDDFSIVA